MLRYSVDVTVRKRKYTVTDAVRRANSLRALKHGKYWKQHRPIPGVVARRRLEEFLPADALAALDAYLDDNATAIESVKQKAIAKVAVLRALIVADIHERGPLVTEPQVGKNSKVLGERVLIHPGLRHLEILDEQLGYRIEDQVAQQLKRERYKRERAELLRRNLRKAALKSFASTHAHRLPPAPQAEPPEDEGNDDG